jgi:hypothetical protein
MKTRTFLSGIAVFSLAMIIHGCNTASPGSAVKVAMEKEIIKEKAMDYLEENNVPEVVVKAFITNHSDTIAREWVVYKKPEEEISVKLPEVYIATYEVNDKEYNEKYSNEGEVLEKNRVINYSILPEKASDLLQNGEYKDWEVTGDVLELLDNISGETLGYIVNIVKSDQKERIIFDKTGKIEKAQIIS